MATANGSHTIRKSALKRKSCYDDFGVKEAKPTDKPGPSKKQRQLHLQSTLDKTKKHVDKPEGKTQLAADTQSTNEAAKDQTQVNVDASRKPGQHHGNERQAFVILVHTFNPESISEVTVGQAFYSLEKANDGVTDLFTRVKPEFVDLVVDIGVASEFDDGGEVYPDVRKRVTPSGRAAYLWHTEEGRGELSVHKILIE